MQEIDSPSPEDMGESHGGDIGPPSPEVVGQKFDEYLDGEKSKSLQIVDRDSSRLFSIGETGQGENKVIYRQYHGLGQSSAGQVKFEDVSHSAIRDSYINLNKIGRVYKEGFPEKETIYIHRDNEDFRVQYSIGNPKGERFYNPSGNARPTPFFGVGYSTEGELSELDLFPAISGQFGATPLEPDHGRFKSVEDMERFADDEKRIKDDYLNVEIVNDDTDEENKLFIITVYDKDDNPYYKLTVPKNMDADRVMAETGALELWKDPYQPPDGIPGKSWGDQEWRTKSFESITGIKLKLVIDRR